MKVRIANDGIKGYETKVTNADTGEEIEGCYNLVYRAAVSDICSAQLWIRPEGIEVTAEVGEIWVEGEKYIRHDLVDPKSLDQYERDYILVLASNKTEWINGEEYIKVASVAGDSDSG